MARWNSVHQIWFGPGIAGAEPDFPLYFDDVARGE